MLLFLTPVRPPQCMLAYFNRKADTLAPSPRSTAALDDNMSNDQFHAGHDDVAKGIQYDRCSSKRYDKLHICCAPNHDNISGDDREDRVQRRAARGGHSHTVQQTSTGARGGHPAQQINSSDTAHCSSRSTRRWSSQFHRLKILQQRQYSHLTSAVDGDADTDADVDMDYEHIRGCEQEEGGMKETDEYEECKHTDTDTDTGDFNDPTLLRARENRRRHFQDDCDTKSDTSRHQNDSKSNQNYSFHDKGTESADKCILGWDAVQQLNWDVIFLLGGGFALSKGFQVSLEIQDIFILFVCLAVRIASLHWYIVFLL